MAVHSGIDRGASQIIVGIARMVMGLCFFIFGVEKIFNVDSTVLYISTELPFPHFILGLAIVIETGLGALLVVGLATRWVAAFFAFYCVFLAIIFHTGLLSFFYHPNVVAQQPTALARPIGDHFYSNMMIAAGFLCLFVSGPGAMALDGGLGKSDRPPA